MGSYTLQLPIINLLDQTLEPGSSKWVEMRNDVRKALEDYGCFDVSYNGISVELKKSMIEAMEELFELPVEAKQRNVCPKPYTGYSSYNGLSESLGIQDADVLEKVNDFTQQLRPDYECNKKISEAIQKFSEKLAEVDVMVRRMLMESFELDYYIDEHLNSTNYRLRLMKYIAPPDVDSNVAAGANANGDVGIDAIVSATSNVHIDAAAAAKANGDDASVKSNANDDGINANASVNDSIGNTIDNDVNDGVGVGPDVNGGTDASANGGGGVGVIVEAEVDEKKLGLHSHTDKNLITIVYQHEIEGLEVQTKDGKWIRLKTSPNSFSVMAGDSLHALTNSRVHPPFHRVRVTEKKKTRYSIGLFSTPKPGYIVQPPKELVDEKHPRVFKPFYYVDLMAFYLTEAGRKAPSALHAYCALSQT